MYLVVHTLANTSAITFGFIASDSSILINGLFSILREN